MILPLWIPHSKVRISCFILRVSKLVAFEILDFLNPDSKA